MPCVVAWRVFWLTMTSRATPEATVGIALTPGELEILDRLPGVTDPPVNWTVSHYLVAAGEHGGLARADPANGRPPRLRVEPRNCGVIERMGRR